MTVTATGVSRSRLGWTLGTIAAALVAAALTAWWTERSEDRAMRANELTQARLVSKAINLSRVVSLSGTPEDVASPDYLRLKEQLTLVRQASPSCRFVYLMGRKADGTVFFYVDSEPAGSKDEATPGQVYGEAPERLSQVFASGTEVTVGPYTDRWGTWVSAFVPIASTQSGEVLAALGMDQDKRHWRAEIAARCAMPVGLVLVATLLAAMLIALRASHRRIQRKRAAPCSKAKRTVQGVVHEFT